MAKMVADDELSVDISHILINSNPMIKLITRIICLIILSVSLIACGSSKSTNKSTSGLPNYGSPNVDQTILSDGTFKITEYSNDSTYGYSEQNPIMVGSKGGGPTNERRFLNSLMGPDGEPITFSRLGSCCHFNTKNGQFGDVGLLDKYQIAHKGLEQPIILYINMYDSDVLKIPVGFKRKQ